MNSVWNRFLDDTFEYVKGSLEFETPELKIDADCTRAYAGKFRIFVNGGQDAIGRVYTKEWRMKVSNQEFKGKQLEIPFEFDTTNLQPGQVVRGHFCVVTIYGEYMLPYEISIKDQPIESELGEIKNLFHFANLAKVNWEAAKACFFEPGFEKLLNGSGGQYLDVYHSLLKLAEETGNKDRILDRFLIHVRKKQEISFECLKSQFLFEDGWIPEKIELVLKKNGWGYCCLNVTVSGDFITLEKTKYYEKDFEKDRLAISMLVDKKMLKRGKNYGTIVIDTGKERISKKITLTNNAGPEEENRIAEKSKGKSSQRSIIEKAFVDVMLRCYLDYRSGRRSLEECVATAQPLLEHERNKREYLSTLYYIHLKMLMKNYNEAGWLIKNVGRKIDGGKKVSQDIYAYYLYLAAMADAGGDSKEGKIIDQFVMQYPDNFFLFWGYSHKEKMREKNPGLLFRTLKEFHGKGCNSPMLYLEAAMVLLDHPSFLSVLDQFEIQILLFMDRYGMYEEKLNEQMYFAAKNVRGFHPLLIQFMQRHPSKERETMVKTIALQYMRTNRYKEDSVAWLAEAVELECRITGLFEAYIRALDFDRRARIPRAAVLYFSYNVVMEDTYLAYVYAKVIQQKEEISESYEDKIRTFTLRQLRIGNINENLAVLYRNLLLPEDMDDTLCIQLGKIAYTNELYVSNDEYNSVIVRHKGLKRQERFYLKKQYACINIYGNAYTMIFEKKNGEIELGKEDYTLHRLINYEQVKKLMGDKLYATAQSMYFALDLKPLSLMDGVDKFVTGSQIAEALLETGELEDHAAKEQMSLMFKGFLQLGNNKKLEEFLQVAHAESFFVEEQPSFIVELCIHGMYGKAYAEAFACGHEMIERTALARMCHYKIEQIHEEYDMDLVKISYLAFEKGRYTDRILSYLVNHFRGNSKQLCKIYEAARKMEIDAVAVAERIGKQLLMANGTIDGEGEIFRYYCRHGNMETLKKAYVCVQSRKYIQNNIEPETAVFEACEKMMLVDEKFPLSAKLALLKYYAKHEEFVSEQVQPMLLSILGECLGNDVYFSFFQSFLPYYPVIEVYTEKEYVEYLAKPGSRINIHYITKGMDEEGNGYYQEEMQEIFPGVFQKSFVVFFGEEIQYYLTESTEKGNHFLFRGEMKKKTQMRQNDHGKYRLINDIAFSMELQDGQVTKDLMKKYADMTYATDQLFRIL